MRYKKLFPELFSGADILQIIGSASSERISKNFNVLVWNIYKARARGWEEDFRAIVRGYDLVMLQESVSNQHYDTFFQNAAPLEWVMARTYKHNRTAASTGIKTGAVARSQGQSFFVSPHAEPILKTPKMLLATTYPLEGSDKSLLAINIHAINFVSFNKFSLQMVQITEAIGQHEGPVIVAGDFNTWNHQRYNSLLEITGKLGLREAKLERKTRMLQMNRHLDHVFYKGLDLKKAEVFFKVQTSDHYPIGLEFQIL